MGPLPPPAPQRPGRSARRSAAPEGRGHGWQPHLPGVHRASPDAAAKAKKAKIDTDLVAEALVLDPSSGPAIAMSLPRGRRVQRSAAIASRLFAVADDAAKAPQPPTDGAAKAAGLDPIGGGGNGEVGQVFGRSGTDSRS